MCEGEKARNLRLAAAHHLHRVAIGIAIVRIIFLVAAARRI